MSAADQHPHDRVIVLAAGRGSRMGGPKALMSVGGRPWWQWQMDRLADAGLESVWVVSEDVLEAMEAHAPDAEWFAIGDPDAPMFDSVVTGVSALEGEPDVRAVFILPVDVPAPTPAVWDELRTAGPVAVPTYDGAHGHPLYLSWSWVEERILPVRAHAGSYRLDALIRDHLREIPVAEPDVVTNLNTPEDVERWLARQKPTG